MEDSAKTERDKLIIRVLADTGIRVGELVGLRVQDLVDHNRQPCILARGKPDDERLVPVPRLFRRLRVFAERGRPKGTHSDRLFLSLRRRPRGDYEPLTESGVEQMVREVGQLAGISRRVYPHLLRHSFATNALRRGMNPIQLKEILGHSSLAMISNVYSHLTVDDRFDAMVRLLNRDE